MGEEKNNLENSQDKLTKVLATGRRKTSVARVWLSPGTGKILINKQPYNLYFHRPLYERLILEPFRATDTIGKFDVVAKLEGGGLTGQADALRLGISRALTLLDPNLKPLLKRRGLLTRDPREKERKKYGQKGARKRFQWTKR
ncbi:MAG: 30S ribosomal protein S9 [Candidatus Omnitrophica bacterium]|nr:30S ribosomal protein S9 [Candidatus Omnitrophota bacterium]MCM8798025.1 30S ribosomal protein S9 [Candidatus Omnitrophota bacterium]